MDSKTISILAYLYKGKNKAKIYKEISTGYKTASDIAKSLNISLSSVCRTLRELENNTLINSANDSDGRGKLYFIPESSWKDIIDTELSKKLQERS